MTRLGVLCDGEAAFLTAGAEGVVGKRGDDDVEGGLGWGGGVGQGVDYFGAFEEGAGPAVDEE